MNMRKIVAILSKLLMALGTALSLSTAPALAQSIPEAARANATFAMKLCVRNYRTLDNILPEFEQAGFQITPDLGIHRALAPAGVLTIISTVNGTGLCTISLDTMGVSEAIPFARTFLESTFPGMVQVGSPEGQQIGPGDAGASNSTCSGLSIFAPQKLIWVTFGTAGQNPVCVENGTVQIIIQM